MNNQEKLKVGQEFEISGMKFVVTEKLTRKRITAKCLSSAGYNGGGNEFEINGIRFTVIRKRKRLRIVARMIDKSNEKL